jgi:hypothetical protein
MRSKEAQPSRILNDRRGLFGLWMSDFSAAVAVFMGGSWALEGSGYELLSLPAAFLLLIGLSPIRLIYRRKIIRDALHSSLTKRVIYDPITKTHP